MMPVRDLQRGGSALPRVVPTLKIAIQSPPPMQLRPLGATQLMVSWPPDVIGLGLTVRETPSSVRPPGQAPRASARTSFLPAFLALQPRVNPTGMPQASPWARIDRTKPLGRLFGTLVFLSTLEAQTHHENLKEPKTLGSPSSSVQVLTGDTSAVTCAVMACPYHARHGKTGFDRSHASGCDDAVQADWGTRRVSESAAQAPVPTGRSAPRGFPRGPGTNARYAIGDGFVAIATGGNQVGGDHCKRRISVLWAAMIQCLHSSLSTERTSALLRSLKDGIVNGTGWLLFRFRLPFV